MFFGTSKNCEKWVFQVSFRHFCQFDDRWNFSWIKFIWENVWNEPIVRNENSNWRKNSVKIQESYFRIPKLCIVLLLVQLDSVLFSLKQTETTLSHLEQGFEGIQQSCFASLKLAILARIVRYDRTIRSNVLTQSYNVDDSNEFCSNLSKIDLFKIIHVWSSLIWTNSRIEKLKILFLDFTVNGS